MTLMLDGRSIERVRIIDDDPMARNGFAYPVEELQLTPVLEDGPLSDISEFVGKFHQVNEAAICDHHLSRRSYATFNGAATAAELYRSSIPAILCTRYRDIIEEIRPYRRHVPVLLNPDALTPEALVQGFTQCVEEFNGHFRPSRSPWRTLVRVEEIDAEREFLYVVLPAWDTSAVISLLWRQLPAELPSLVREGRRRFHAKVNIGAETHEDLFFEEWEIE